MGASGLGTLLVKEGLLSEQDRATIGRTSGQSSWAFAKGVIALGLLDEDELAAFLAERTQHRVAAKDILAETRPEALGVLDVHMLERLEVLPIDVSADTLTVAMADPLDKSTLRQLEFFTGRKVKPVIASFSQIYEGLKKISPRFEPARSPLEAFLDHHAASAARRQRLEELDTHPVGAVKHAKPKKASAGATKKASLNAASLEDAFNDVDLDGDLGDAFDLDVKGDDELNLDKLEALEGDGPDADFAPAPPKAAAKPRGEPDLTLDPDSDDGIDGLDLGDTDAADDMSLGGDDDTDELAGLGDDMDGAELADEDPFAVAEKALAGGQGEPSAIGESIADDLSADDPLATDDLLADLTTGASATASSSEIDDELGDLTAMTSSDAAPLSADDDLLGDLDVDARGDAGEGEIPSDLADDLGLGGTEVDELGLSAAGSDEQGLDDAVADVLDLDGGDASEEKSADASADFLAGELNDDPSAALDAGEEDLVDTPGAEAKSGDKPTRAAQESEDDFDAINLDDDLLAGVAGDNDIEDIAGDDLLGGLNDDSSIEASDLTPPVEHEELALDEIDESDDLLEPQPTPAAAPADEVKIGVHNERVAAINQAMMRLSMASTPERASALTIATLAPALPFALVCMSDGGEWTARFGWETTDDEQSVPLQDDPSTYLDPALITALDQMTEGQCFTLSPSGRLATWLEPVKEAHGLKTVRPGGKALAIVGVWDESYRRNEGFIATTLELMKILQGRLS